MQSRAMGWTMCLVGGLACVTAAQAQDAGGQPEKVVVRSEALFDFDRDTLKPEDAQKILGELGRAGKVSWESVNAVGYTDSVGTPEYNQGLSERRARAVKTFLVGKGVDGKMVMTAGKAAQEPVANNDSDEGRAKNRRTAIEFTGVRLAQP